MAWNPEPHNLFSVSAGVVTGTLALRAIWRARYAASEALYKKIMYKKIGYDGLIELSGVQFGLKSYTWF